MLIGEVIRAGNDVSVRILKIDGNPGPHRDLGAKRIVRVFGGDISENRARAGGGRERD
jgi:hypothetical protein